MLKALHFIIKVAFHPCMSSSRLCRRMALGMAGHSMHSKLFPVRCCAPYDIPEEIRDAVSKLYQGSAGEP